MEYNIVTFKACLYKEIHRVFDNLGFAFIRHKHLEKSLAAHETIIHV